MTEINPCSWLQNVGAAHTASQMRLSVGSLLAGVSDDAASLVSRGGVNPSLGGRLQTVQTGTGALSVTVNSGIVHVPGTSSFTQGTYVCINDNPVIRAIAAPDGSLNRIDAVIAQVHDDFYDSLGENEWEIAVVTGTPDASPQLPDLPESSMLLSEVLVQAQAAGIFNADITDRRVFTPTGILSVADEAERDALISPHSGLAVWLRDNEFLDIRGASSWVGINRPPDAVSVYNGFFQNIENHNTEEFEPTSPALEITFIAPQSGKGRIDIHTSLDADSVGDRIEWDVEIRRDNSGGDLFSAAGSPISGGVGRWFWDPDFPFRNNYTVMKYIEGMTPGATYWAQLQFNTIGTDMDISQQAMLYTPIYH